MNSNNPDQTGFSGGGRAATARIGPNMVGTLTLSYVLAFGLIILLVLAVGVWGVLAATRILDLLIEGGIVQLHDLQIGFFAGIPDISHYWQSQDPIDWRIVLIAFLFFAGYELLKAVQFHGIARSYGLDLDFSQHARAYWYGDGVDRFLPYNIGAVGTAEALAKQGEPFDRALSAAVVSQAFVLFEILVFGTLGLILLGWSGWLSDLIWAVVILGLAYYIVHPGQKNAHAAVGRMSIVAGLQAVRWMARERPMLLVTSCLLSIAAFALLDAGVYALMHAFDSTVVIVAVEFPALLMGLVGAYLASRIIPVTPGGFGVFEWGFATGFVIGGGDLDVALVVIAILVNILRSLTSGVLMGMSVWWFGIPTNLRSVMTTFKRAVVHAPG